MDEFKVVRRHMRFTGRVQGVGFRYRAKYAANGMGKQATITVAVTNKELRDRLSAINAKIGGWKEGFDPFYGAPAILIVLADKNWANRVYDGSLVMGNMMLLFVVYL